MFFTTNILIIGIANKYFYNAHKVHFNVDCDIKSIFGKSDMNSIKKAIQADNLVVLITNSSKFTDGKQHHVLLYKIDNQGRYYLKDPKKENAINKKYNNKAFSESEITDGALGFYIFERYSV